MEKLSVAIITYNEEQNIGRCIDSVSKIADEIIVVDSYSFDQTIAIALSKGAIVKQSKFDGYISQKNIAINLASHHYVLLLDADEALSDQLAAAVFEAKKKGFEFKAYSMNRCSFFCGKFIKHGLWYPDRKTRLFDKRAGKCGGLNPHDRIIIDAGIPVKHLDGDLEHYTFDSVKEYIQRNDEVSTVAAQSLFDAGIRKPWAKIIFSPLWAFINGYLLRLGFLDGYVGWIIGLHTANQCFAKYQKLHRLQRQSQSHKEMAWE